MNSETLNILKVVSGVAAIGVAAWWFIYEAPAPTPPPVSVQLQPLKIPEGNGALKRNVNISATQPTRREREEQPPVRGQFEDQEAFILRTLSYAARTSVVANKPVLQTVAAPHVKGPTVTVISSNLSPWAKKASRDLHRLAGEPAPK